MNHRDLAGVSSAEFLKAYTGVFKKLVDDPDLFAERQPRARSSLVAKAVQARRIFTNC